MIKVGLIGLGVMGVPMAKNIARAGLDLVVYNRSPGPARQFEGTDVTVASSARALFKAVDAIVLMLKDDAATDAVLGREGPNLAADVAGKIVVNTATLTPGYSEKLGRDVEAAGGAYVEAPVSGSQGPAEAGELLVMTAGSKADVDKVDPIFRAIGKETIYCGAAPNAMRMKSVSNALLAGLMTGLVESLNLAERIGLDAELFSKVALGGPMASDFLRMKLPRALAADFSPQASIRNVAYSLDVLLEAAGESGAPVTATRAMRRLCADAERMGLAEEDILAVLKVLKSARSER